MTEEIETAQSRPSPSPAPGDDKAQEKKPHDKPRLANQLSLKIKNFGKTAAVALVTILILALSGSIYFLSKERTRAFNAINAKLAQLESHVQTIESKQGNSASTQSVESLRRDLQNFKEQTAGQFLAKERSIQEIKNLRPLPSTQQQNTAVEEQAPTIQQTTEHFVPPHPEPGNPAEAKSTPPPERSKEAQNSINFIETLAKNFIAIAKEVFHQIWDFLSELLKRPV